MSERKYRPGARVIYASDKVRGGIAEGDAGVVIGSVGEGYVVQFGPDFTSLAVLGENLICAECEGDGITVVGWDPIAYENIEGPCPYCYVATDNPADAQERAAQLQEIVWPDALDHRPGTDRTSGGDHEGEKSRKMNPHYLT